VKKNNFLNSVVSPIIFSILIIVGIFIGSFFNVGNSNTNNNRNNKFNKLDLILDYIDEEYVDTINTSNLTENIIPKILESLDPHSVYIPAKDLMSINESLGRKF
jgi:carboxyl-terminal processing protease